jgi:hypothetical protein
VLQHIQSVGLQLRSCPAVNKQNLERLKDTASLTTNWCYFLRIERHSDSTISIARHGAAATLTIISPCPCPLLLAIHLGRAVSQRTSRGAICGSRQQQYSCATPMRSYLRILFATVLRPGPGLLYGRCRSSAMHQRRRISSSSNSRSYC